MLQTRLQPEVQKLALDVEYIVSVPSAGPRDRDKAGHCSQPADLALEASCLHSLPPQDAFSASPKVRFGPQHCEQSDKRFSI